MANGHYEVGKNKPPKHSQWKKGQSGNPSGSKGKQPAVEMPFAYWVTEALKESVSVNDDGKSVQMPVGQALSKKVVRMMLTASPLHLKYLVAICQELNVFALEEALIQQKNALRREVESHVKAEKEAKQKGENDDDGKGEDGLGNAGV